MNARKMTPDVGNGRSVYTIADSGKSLTTSLDKPAHGQELPLDYYPN